MRQSRINPFPAGDVDRHQIWEALVERDIVAFIDQDWEATGIDFLEDGFVGHSGPSNPDHWRITYPSLAAYREDWIRQAKDFSKVELAGISTTDFLFDATLLRDIEITGDQAIAHKKFNGKAKTTLGDDLVLNWQTLYRLRLVSDVWKISGFLGYLPNPMPDAAQKSQAGNIEIPPAAKQHKTAGPYSPVLQVRGNGFVVISGQGPINDDGAIVGTTIQEQTSLTLDNCIRQLTSGGVTLSEVFKVTVYLKDMKDWDAFNVVYREYFQTPYPARTAIQAVLWGGIKVEIDMLAIIR